MTDRENLTKLVEESFADQHNRRRMIVVPDTVNYLLANGVVVRTKGEWEEKPFLLGTTNVCSKCGEYYGMPHGKYNFCPNCGADMRKGENG